VKRLVLTTCSVLAVSASNAQTVSYDAVRLAEQITESAWPSFEHTLGILGPGLEVEIRKSGATESAARAVVEEIRKLITRDNVARITATIISDKFTAPEMTELRGFLQSPAGRKYLDIFSDVSNSSLMLPLLRQACEASERRLGFFDRGSINTFCRQ
jgi:hypothetical protein